MNESEKDQDVEMAYNFVVNFHKIRPDFLKGTCWEELHKMCLRIYNAGGCTHSVQINPHETHIDKMKFEMRWLTYEEYLPVLAKRIAQISQEKDFVGLYNKYTEQKGTKSHTHTD